MQYIILIPGKLYKVFVDFGVRFIVSIYYPLILLGVVELIRVSMKLIIYKGTHLLTLKWVHTRFPIPLLLYNVVCQRVIFYHTHITRPSIIYPYITIRTWTPYKIGTNETTIKFAPWLRFQWGRLDSNQLLINLPD